jgi:hypothetical protein
MLIIGSLEKLYKAQPEIIKNMYLYKILMYKKPVRLHNDLFHGECHRVVKCLTNVEFFYHDTVHHVNAGNYILFDCQILHGNKSDTKYKRTEYELYLYNNPNVILTHKLLDNL